MTLPVLECFKKPEPKHTNNGYCPECLAIFAVYPNFHPDLMWWFFELQAKNLEAHISCAGRGRVAQELVFEQHRSRAHWGESAHNYNMAIDIFEILDGEAFWGERWYNGLIPEAIKDTGFTWYGAPDAVYKEFPHVEITNWKQYTKEYPLVEPL